MPIYNTKKKKKKKKKSNNNDNNNKTTCFFSHSSCSLYVRFIKRKANERKMNNDLCPMCTLYAIYEYKYRWV